MIKNFKAKQYEKRTNLFFGLEKAKPGNSGQFVHWLEFRAWRRNRGFITLLNHFITLQKYFYNYLIECMKVVKLCTLQFINNVISESFFQSFNFKKPNLTEQNVKRSLFSLL